MLKFQNPHFKPAAQLAKENNAAANAPAIDAWMRTQTGNRVITAGEIKAQFPAMAGQLDRESLNMIAALLGVQAINPEDTDA